MKDLYFELKDLLLKNRSYRRFQGGVEIERNKLEKIVELVRLCASGRNAQPLKYLIVNKKEDCDKLFPNLKWAGYYKDWDGPSQSQLPSAYIIQCLDNDIAKNPMADDGLQLEAITLGATSLGFGCCIIKSFNVKEVSSIFDLAPNILPLHVVAIGVPAEVVELVEIKNGDFKYYRDDKDHQCVPKRSLQELLIN